MWFLHFLLLLEAVTPPPSPGQVLDTYDIGQSFLPFPPPPLLLP